jgi:hypothetical protein
LTGISTFNVGKTFNAGNFWNGPIKEIGYFAERLDNSTLDQLSDGTLTLSDFGAGVLDRLRRQHYQRQKWRAQGSPGRATWAGRPVRFPGR